MNYWFFLFCIHKICLHKIFPRAAKKKYIYIYTFNWAPNLLKFSSLFLFSIVVVDKLWSWKGGGWHVWDFSQQATQRALEYAESAKYTLCNYLLCKHLVIIVVPHTDPHPLARMISSLPSPPRPFRILEKEYCRLSTVTDSLTYLKTERCCSLMLQARLDMRRMGRILRHFHYMGDGTLHSVSCHARREVCTPWRTHSLLLSWLSVSTGKERARDHDCDLKASQVIPDGAHESVG